ncbi:hypothetical protein [Haloferula sargassicola]|uniref:Glycosyl transferase family 8 n=1 Tax=Haloferula sargassicola TaxID=490096 RepID=A0ABP9USY1_9BACT
MEQCTIVSAADGNYFWGLLLLTASARKAGLKCPVHLLVRDLSAAQTASLKALGNVSIEEMDPANRRNPCTWKPAALRGAKTDYIAWMDADCAVIGDISELLVPDNDEFQIRVRDAAENARAYSRLYAEGDPRGPVPAGVLETWRRDVADLDEPHLDKAVVTNCLVLHRRHLPFIELWHEQIEKVMPAGDGGVVNRDQPAYFMTDESVFSSLLAFSSLAPPIAEFQLNKIPEKHVAHFGVRPKPWNGWTKPTWYAYDEMMAVVDFAVRHCPELPELPPALRRKNRGRYLLESRGRDIVQRAKQLVRG